MMDPFDYRWTETQRMKQMLRYGPKEYKADWETAIALVQLISYYADPTPEQEFTPEGELRLMRGENPHLERLLDACMMRVIAYSEVTGDLPWK